MKVLVALALLWLGTEASHAGYEKLSEPPFLPGRSHHYELTVNLTAGVPGLSDQMAKSVLKLDVVIKAKSSVKFLLKVEKYRISEPMKAIQEDDDDQTIRFKRDPQFEAELAKPIECHYTGGQNIETIVCSWNADDAKESVTLKMAILRQLMLKMKKLQRCTRSRIESISSSVTPLPVMYEVVEEDDVSRALVRYLVTSSPYPEYPEEENVYNITKTWIYERLPSVHEHHNLADQGCMAVCRWNKKHTVNNPYAAGCPYGYEPHHAPLKASRTSHYHLKEVGSKPLMEEFLTEEKHVANMYDQDMNVKTRYFFKLKAITNKDVLEPQRDVIYSSTTPFPSAAEASSESYPYRRVTEDPNSRKEADDLWNEIYGSIERSAIVNLADRLLNDVSEAVVLADTKETALIGEKVIELQKAIAVLKKVQLDILGKKIVEYTRVKAASEKEKIKRQLFLDILPLAGTDDSLKYILYLIKSNKLSTFEATEVIEAIPENLIDPDYENAKDLSEIVDLPFVKRYHVLHSAAYLTLSKVMHKVFVNPDFSHEDRLQARCLYPEVRDDRQTHHRSTYPEENEDIVDEDFSATSRDSDETFASSYPPNPYVTKYLQEIRNKLKESRKLQEKIVYIQALAHVSHYKVLSYLAPYIEGTAEDLEQYSPSDVDYVQTITIFALHQVVSHYPEIVQRYVSPLYFNLTELSAIRMAAFSVLIRTNPSLSLLQRIATDSYLEPSREVGSYVYSTLQSFGNSTDPCMKLTADRIKHIISQVRDYDIGAQYSKSIIKTYFDELRNFGLYGRFSVIYSNESVIPRSLYTGGSYNIDSLREIALQAAIHVKGLEVSDLLKYVDPEIFHYFGVNYVAPNIDEKVTRDLNFVPRLPSELRVAFYRRFFYTSSYHLFDAETIVNYLRPIKDQIQNYFTVNKQNIKGHYVKLYIPSSYHAVVYTGIGLPVEFNMRHPVIFSLKLEARKPSEDHMNISYYIRPSVYYTSYVSNAIINKYDRHVYGTYRYQTYHLSVPIELNVTLREDESALEVSFKLPQSSKQIYSHHSEAGTYARGAKLVEYPDQTYLQSRQPIRTYPLLFKYEKTFYPFGFLPLYTVRHSENIQEDVGEIPRSMEDLMQMAVEEVRNSGWRYRDVNATLVRSPRMPVEKVTFRFSYNKTHDVKQLLTPVTMQHGEHWSSEEREERSSSEYKQVLSERRFAELRREDPSSTDFSKEDALKWYEYIAKKAAKIQHEFRVRMETTPRSVGANLLIAYNRTYDGQGHSVFAHANLEGAAISSPYQVCFSHVMLFVKVPSEFHYDYHKYHNYWEQFYSALGFQPQCTTAFKDSYIKVSGRLYNVPYDELFDRGDLAETPREEDFYPETERQCGRDQQEGKSQSSSCRSAAVEESYYNRLIMKISYKEELPPFVRNFTYKVEEAIKAAYYGHMESNSVDVRNEPKTVRLTVDYVRKLTDEPVVNIYIEKPKENINFSRVSADAIYPPSSILTYHESHLYDVTKGGYPVECSLMENYVRTYDDETYELPEDSCQYVLSMHCAERKTFIVLAKKISEQEKTKEVTIYVKDYAIVLRPKDQYGVYTVLYNNNSMEVLRNDVIFINGSFPVYVYLIPTINSENFLVMEAENIGLKVKYDGKNVKVQVHPAYKGRLCGLCSEFDGEGTQEYYGPDDCLYQDSEDFAHSSVVNSAECGVDTTPKHPFMCESRSPLPDRTHFERQYPDSEEPEDTDDANNADQMRSPKKKLNIHIQRGEFICFSNHPQPVCEDDEDEVDRELRTVDFHCLPKQDATTRRMMLESQHKLLDKLASKSVDVSQSVYVAKYCSPRF